MRANLLPLFLFLCEELLESSAGDNLDGLPSIVLLVRASFLLNHSLAWALLPSPQVLTLGGGTASVLRTKGQRVHIFTRIQNISV